MFGFFQGWRFYRQPASWRPAVPGAARHQKRTKFQACHNSELPPGSSIPVPPGSGPIPEQSFGMFARQPDHFPILAVGQRAGASWLRGGLDRHDPQPNKVSGFFRTAANQRCGLAKPASSHAASGRKPEQSVG